MDRSYQQSGYKSSTNTTPFSINDILTKNKDSAVSETADSMTVMDLDEEECSSRKSRVGGRRFDVECEKISTIVCGKSCKGKDSQKCGCSRRYGDSYDDYEGAKEKQNVLSCYEADEALDMSRKLGVDSESGVYDLFNSILIL